jgi:hypothetical protein
MTIRDGGFPQNPVNANRSFAARSDRCLTRATQEHDLQSSAPEFNFCSRSDDETREGNEAGGVGDEQASLEVGAGSLNVGAFSTNKMEEEQSQQSSSSFLLALVIFATGALMLFAVYMNLPPVLGLSALCYGPVLIDLQL